MATNSAFNIRFPEYLKTLSTLSDLRAYSVSKVKSGDTVQVTGKDNFNDGLGSFYVWDPLSTLDDDNNSVIRPTFSIGIGRWIKIFTRGDDRSPVVIVDAEKFLKGDGTPEDSAKIRAWIAAGKAVSSAGGIPIMRAVGTYRIASDSTYGNSYAERKALRADGLHNAQFDCGFATWLFDSKYSNASYANVFNLENSDNVCGNLGTVDWVRKPFVQGTVTKGATYIDVTLDAGFSYGFNQVQRIEVYDRNKRNQYKILTKSFNSGADVAGWTVTNLFSNVVRIDFTGDSDGLNYLNKLTNGDVVVATYRAYGADAFRFNGCRNLDIKACVTTTGGMSYRFNDCTNITADLEVYAAPGSLISSTSDGIHVAGCRGYLEINGSVRHTGDDPVNITNDSYQVAAVSGTRSFTIYSGYPYILPRVNDILAYVNDDGISTAIGKVLTINTSTGATTVDTDVPAAMNTLGQVVNLSAYPNTTFTSTFIAESCRGHVRIQVPEVSGSVKAIDLTGTVTVEYIPYFTGEGIPPSNATLTVEAIRCATLQSCAGAVVVQSYQLDGGGYSQPSSITKVVLNAVVRTTKNSGIFIAGVSFSAISAITDRCCQSPDTTNFALANKTVAMVNCDKVYFPSLTNLDATSGTVGRSGGGTIVTGQLLNYTTA